MVSRLLKIGVCLLDCVLLLVLWVGLCGVVYVRYERGFLSQKGSGRGRGVKEKDLNKNKKNTSFGISVTMDSDDTMNDDTPIGVASAVQEG
ncbi:hypothetical protein Tco_0069363, partial [Tanacetum coccineum]